MLVSATEMLKKAKAGHYAVGQFNINNLEWTKSILLTAKELRSPVILGVSEGAGKYMGGYDVVVGMVNGLLKDLDIDVPVALHLDHGSFEGCYKCIEAGFSSIMFDGSHYPIAENVEKTTELVKAAHSKGLSIEAEVGSIGGEEDGVIGMGECADPKECKSIADLGVDFLAAGIGNIHGKYPANWKGLSFETLAAVQELTGELPLVLQVVPESLQIRSRKRSTWAYPRSTLTPSASWHLLMLPVSTSRLVRIWKARDLTLVSFWLPVQKLSRLLLRRRWNCSDLLARLNNSGIKMQKSLAAMRETFLIHRKFLPMN